MKDLAGSSLKTAQKVNFKNKSKKIKGFLGSSADRFDIFRFKARSSSIDITTRKLDVTTTKVDLYAVDKKVNQTLKKIGKSEFSKLKRKKRKRFLSGVDLDVELRQNRSLYNTELEKGTYFLVIRSAADTNGKYSVKFKASKLTTTPSDSTTPTTPPTPPTPAIPTTPTTPITTDAIGDTIATAQAINLGSNQVEGVGGTDSADVFQFTLGDRQTVSLNLSGLTQNADLSLLDSSGNDLKVSSGGGTAAESIVRHLEKGTYYVKVDSSSATGTNYTLTTASSAATETALYTPDGSSLPQDQGELRFAQLPFTTEEADILAEAVQASLGLPKVLTLNQIEDRDLLATKNATQTAVANGVRVNSQVNDENTGYVGYSNYTVDYSSLNPLTLSADVLPVNSSGVTVLDADKGYTLSFELAVQSEASSSDNRAGFSIVVVSSDGQRAIELGFDDSGIFAQSENLTAENEVTPSGFAMSDFVTYDLYVVDAGYQLFANGSQIMSGAMQSSYNFDPATSDPPLPSSPYTTENFLFFGDNTDAASATFTLGQVSLFT